MIGIFEAQIADYGVSQTKAGNPQVFVKFRFEHEGAQKELTWYGSFAGGAKEITQKTLLFCGLKPQDFGRLVNLNQGIQSNMLDTNKVLNIDVQEEPKQDGSGMRTIIQWVNDPQSSPQIKKIDEATNAQYFGQMGAQYEGDLMRLAGELGIPLNNGGQNTMGNPGQNQNQNFNQNQGQGQNQNFQTMGQNQTQNNGQNVNQGQGQTQGQNVNQNQQNQNQNFNQNQGQNNGGFQAPF